jgi:formyl-CoA transferase
MLQQVVMDDGTQLTAPGIIPKLSLTPGGQWRNAPALGQDTESVLREVGLTEEQISELRARGVVA